MRVCFLTHYFPPEVGAPQARIDTVSRALAAQGHEVTVHTGFPHYPDGVIQPPYRNRPWSVEWRGGVRVVRSIVYPSPNRGLSRRLLNHASFALSAAATAPLSGAFDVVVAETPPLFTAAAGVAYAALKRAACVVNIADRWPASAVELGALRSRRAIAAAEALERWVYRHADVLVAPTEGIVSALNRIPEASGKCRRVWPVVDLDRFAAGERATDGVNGPLRILFAGTVGLAQGLEVLVEASRLAGPATVHTTIAGDGAEAPRVRARVREQGLTNVELLGAVAADKVPELYARADVGAVLLRDLPIFEGALPTKMLEAMAAGLPLLLAARGESARLLEDAAAGLVVPPGNPALLAEACARLHSHPELRRKMGAAGRTYVEKHFGSARAAADWSAQLHEAAALRQGRWPSPI